MKKYRNYYIAIWLLLFAVFNLIVFVITPDTIETNGVIFSKYEGGSFWPGYIGITVAFLLNLICALVFFSRTDSAEKAFLNISMLTLSWSSIIAIGAIGGLTMIIPNFPQWVGALICLIVGAVYAVAVLKARVAAEAVGAVETKVKEKISAMKSIIADAEMLAGKSENEEIKEECRKVYEALRYSDPMSSEELAPYETRISAKLLDLGDAVKAGKIDEVKKLAAELIELVRDRAIKCKALK